MPRIPFSQVFVEEAANARQFTDEVLKRLKGIPVREKRRAGSSNTPCENDDMGKDTLHLLQHKGEFLKPCPGTRRYICCGYRILNIGTNCPLDCSYCILQAYVNQPNIRVFVNLPGALDTVFQEIDSSPDRLFRVGTGEFTDSLAIDPITRWSDLLIPLFSKRKNAVLELKTKTAQIERLLATPAIKHRDRIIVSWSLNSPFIAATEEHKAASLRKRLEAAQRCQTEGFVLGFHFDPLIPHHHWKEEYLKTLEMMDKYLDPKRIIWISLGAFRYMPALKPIIRRRQPGTCILNGEFIRGLDGKMRYFKPIRIDLYAFMAEHLAQWHSNLGIYLCMESDEVWQASLGWSPHDSIGLSQYLDRRVRKIFT